MAHPDSAHSDERPSTLPAALAAGLARIERPIAVALEWAVVALMVLMTLDVSYQVAMGMLFSSLPYFEETFGLSGEWAFRLFGGQPTWTDEMALMLLIWVALVGSAVAYKRDAHLGIDVLALTYGPAGRRAIGIGSTVVVLAFAALVMTWGGVYYVADRFRAAEVSASLPWQRWIWYVTLPLAGLAISFFALQRILEYAVGRAADHRPQLHAGPTRHIIATLVVLTLLVLLATGRLGRPEVLLVVCFAVLIAYFVPISFALGVATILTWGVVQVTEYGAGLDTALLPSIKITIQKMLGGIESFPLLAIPFFILSGLIMGQGGIARRLIDLAQLVFGWLHAGLAMVNVAACMFFGAISGSATAATSSIGSFLIPIMEEEGYEKNYSTAVTMAAATTGLVIPPSNIMIVYAVVQGDLSIAALFMAGFLPGVIIGGTLMLAARWAHRGTWRTMLPRFVLFNLWVLGCFVVPWFALASGCIVGLGLLAGLGVLARRGTRAASARLREGGWPALARPIVHAGTVLGRAVLSLLLIVIVLGGILSGWFTPTEASVTAVIYSLLLAVVVYREVALRQLPEIFLQAGITTAFIMLLIGTSTAMGYAMATLQIPEMVSSALIGITDNGVVILLIVNLILLAVGTFMDMTPAVLIFTPIFWPVAQSLGMDSLHFGLVLIVNLCIGLCTPPVGSVLFVGCGVAKTSIAAVMKPMLPMYAMMVTSLLIITYLSKDVILWLPIYFNTVAAGGP